MKVEGQVNQLKLIKRMMYDRAECPLLPQRVLCCAWLLRRCLLFNHEPSNYLCPFCILLNGGDNLVNRPQDLVYRDSRVTAFVAPQWWPNNEGHILIIPNKHYENLYDLPREYAHRIQDLAQTIAIAFKQVYGCHGVSTRQHNEPAGNQDVWHYHLHVFPRYDGDNLYRSHRSPEMAHPEKRQAYAERLKLFLEEFNLPD